MGRTVLRAIFFSLVMLAGGAVVHAGDDPFPVYDCLRPNVSFWTKVYSQYATDQGIIHDRDRLDIIYEVIDLVPPGQAGARKINEKRVERAKEKYSRILDALARGGNPGSAEEQRVAELFGADAGPAAFKGAKGRLRLQVGQKNRFREGIIRSGSHLEEIKNIIRGYQLPEDLAYLPHVESSFNYQAYSKFGAAGIWQFTQETGKRFLTVDYVLDERRDPLRATYAAAAYLKQAYEELRCWPSAVTAYNYGTAGMIRAKQDKETFERVFTEYDQGRFKFASRNFYAEYLAARDVAKNYRQFFGELQLAEPIRTSEVKLAGFAPVADLARHFKEDIETLKRLNPALREPVFTGQKLVPKGYALRIPRKDQPQLTKLIAGLDQNVFRPAQKRSRFYQVRRGDTAGAIARTHGISLQALVSANQLDRRGTVYAGQNLRIPSSDERVVVAAANLKRQAAEPEPVKIAEISASREKIVQVAMLAPTGKKAAIAAAAPEPDASPVKMAEAAGTAAADPGREKPRTAVPVPVAAKDEIVPASPALPAAALAQVAAVNPAVVTGNLAVEKVVEKNGQVYGSIRVEPGETLGHYAEWLGVPTQAIRRLNNFPYNRTIKINQPLKIPLDRVAREQFEERRYEYHKEIEEDFFANYRSQEIRVYQIRKGDNIWSLCQNEFEVPLWLLRKYNESIDFGDLKPAQEILIPVVEKISEA